MIQIVEVHDQEPHVAAEKIVQSDHPGARIRVTAANGDKCEHGFPLIAVTYEED